MSKKVVLGALLIESVSLIGSAPAEAKSKRHSPGYSDAPPHNSYRHNRVRVVGFNGPGTYVAAPRSYGSDPSYTRNVPRDRPDAFQSVNGCYGGRQQVREGNRLVWVPDVTCPYTQDSF